MPNATDFPGGKPTNNIYNTFGNYVHLTIYRNFNRSNAGRGHPLTHNREMSFCRGRTTLLFSIGP
jgi:hypothetical protein